MAGISFKKFPKFKKFEVIAQIAGRIATIVWTFIKGLRDFIGAHHPEILAGIVALMEFGLAWNVSKIDEDEN